MKTKISYASEEGLKELYRRAVSRIPDVDTELDYYSENPIANSTVTNALANLASYLVVPGTGSDHHPNIPSGTESEMVLYFVKVASKPGKDNYKEWIWTGKWECIGEPSIVVDDILNIHSMNPITNHAVTEAMLNFGGFEKVNGTGADHHPDVANPSTKVIYLVEVPGTPEPDHCMEWIWEASGKWVCIGSTSIEVDTELDPVSGNPLANSTITAEIDRIDTRIDDEHEYTEGEVERLDTRVDNEHEYTEGEVSRLDTRVDNEHDYIVREVDRLDTRIDELCLIITDVDGTISGTTMTVFVDNCTYTKFSVPDTIENLVVKIADWAESGNVSRSMFEFTAPEESVLKTIKVIDQQDTERLTMSPMSWPVPVTYQGSVTNGIATIIGYIDVANSRDPLNPLGLPEFTVRLKFNTTDAPTFAHGEATLVDSSRGGWSIWDLTYESSDWTQLLARQSHLVEILGANATNVTNMLAFVNGCSNLEKIALFDTSMVENMCYAFGYCPKLETLPEFDLSSITNMSYAFCGCHALKSFTARTPHLRGTKIMFQGCRSLESVDIDTENVTDFEQMFQGCTALVHGPDIDLSSAQNLKYMFEDCTALEDVPNYNTSNGVNFYGMFYNCSSLNDVPDLNTNSAECMQLMFNNCSSLVTAPAFNTSTVTDMKYMFSGCRALVNVTPYDTTSLEECQGMFSLTAITEVPDMDLSKIKNLSTMFGDCTSLVTIPDMNIQKAVDVSWMFAGCNNVEHGAFDLYTKLINRTSITSYSNCFKDCGKNTETGLEELEMIMTSWGGLQEIPLNTIRCRYAAGTTPTLANGSYTLVSAEDNIYDITNDASYWYYTVEGDTNLLEVIKGNLVKTNGIYRTFRDCSNLTKVGKLCTSTNLDSCFYAFGNCTSLVSVELFETANVTDMYSMFYMCNNLESVPQFNTSKVSDFRWMFYNCSKLTELPLLDTHRATSFYYTFAYCSNLTSLPLFDTSSVTEMTNAFEGCSKITTIPQFDFANVTTMRYTFRYCYALTSIPLLNTSNVTDMYYAFYYCNNLTNVPLLDTSNVSNMRYMLAYCDLLTELPLFSTESATDMYRAFYNCFNVQSGALAIYQQASTQTNPPTSYDQCFTNCGRDTESGLAELDQIPVAWGGNKCPNITVRFTDGVIPQLPSSATAVQLSESPNIWKVSTGTSNDWGSLFYGQTELLEVISASSSDVTSTCNMFNNCEKLTSVALFDTSSVTDMSSMFRNCKALTTVPLFDTSSVTNMSLMFAYCEELTSVPLFNTSKVTNMEESFCDCRKVESGILALYTQVSSQENVPANHIKCFDRCGVDTETGLEELNQIPVAWGGRALAEYSIRMRFRDGVTPRFSRGTTIQVTSSPNVWDFTYNNSSWNRLLSNQTDLIEVLDATTSNVTNMENIFIGCTSLTTVALFDTSNLTSSGSMFQGCTSLTTVPEFDLSNVTNMLYMFQGCTSLTTVPLFDTSKVNKMDSMFAGCSSLCEVPRFNTANVTTSTWMFQDCSSLTQVPLFDTRSLLNAVGMFSNCTSLTSVPLFNTSSLRQMNNMFQGCTEVQSGALALYQQVSTQSPKPSYYSGAFTDCGSNTISGRADLMEIPKSWGGLKVIFVEAKFTDGITPTFSRGTVTQVSASPNIWRVELSEGSYLDQLFQDQTDLIEVTNMCSRGLRCTGSYRMFYRCTNLEKVDVIDVYDSTNMSSMFEGCTKLKSIPAINGVSASAYRMFYGCESLESALELNLTLTDVRTMFCNCKKITAVPELVLGSTVTSTSMMFQNCESLVEVTQFDTSTVTSMESMFYGCTSLPEVPLFNTANVTRMTNMFMNCSSLTSVPLFDTSSVSNMSYMLENCVNVQTGTLALYTQASTQTTVPTNHSSAFKLCGSNTETGREELEQIPKDWGGTMLGDYTIRVRYKDGRRPYSKGTNYQISTSPNIWDIRYENSDWTSLIDDDDNLLEVITGNTTGVTNMTNMFTMCSNLTTVNLLTPTVTIMDYMFYYCGKLSSVTLPDTSNVTSMRNMFYDCFELVRAPEMDTSNVTDMSGMFNCSTPSTTVVSKLEYVPQYDTSKVTDMNCMFISCQSLTEIPLLNTSNVTNMYAMFAGCRSLTHLPNLDTSKVTILHSMFSYCTSLSNIPYIDTSRATNLSGLFNNCTSLTAIPQNIDFTNVTNTSKMLQNCSNIQSGALALYQLLLTKAIPVTTYSDTFTSCGSNTVTGLAELNQIPLEWGGNFDRYNPAFLPTRTIRVKYAQGETPTAGDTQTLVDATENIWDIYKEDTNWNLLFYQDTNLIEVISSNFTGVTKIGNAFHGCTNLIRTNPFNMSSVKLAVTLFADCTSLTEIEEIKGDSFQETGYMFRNCTSLRRVGKISSGYNLWNLECMFDGCTALEYVNLSSLVTYSVSNMKYMFRNCYNLRTMPDIGGYRTGTLTNIDCLFQNCYKIESGILSRYESLSQLTNLSSHFSVFENCGRDSQTGAAELAQIPDDWKYPAITEFTLKFADGATPSFSKGEATQLTSSPNVWKLTITNDSSLSSLFRDQTRLIEVVSADVKAAKNLYSMFYGCTSLTTVPLFDTSNATDMSYMFRGCSSLTTIPRFDTSKVTNMNYAFAVCNNVQSGALALYQQASTQETPPSSHTGTFLNCGTNTTTGSSELAQIPSDWK